MIIKPNLQASEKDLLDFVDQWVELCASGYINEAFTLLDVPLDQSRFRWSAKDLKAITFDHFDDGKQPIITSPETVEGNIRKDVFAYDDESGWGIEYDLPMNGVVSDFTLTFNFIKLNGQLKVVLDDCHVM